MTLESLFSRLRPYQKEGVAFLVASDSALLADEMGLGKTVQTILAMSRLKETDDVRRILIVTPVSLTSNWSREFRAWGPELAVRRVHGSPADRRATYGLPITVLIASYQQIRMDIQRILSDQVAWDLVVLDEAQWIKNPNSSTSLACKLLPRRKSWAISATPLENRIEEFSSVMDFSLDQLGNGGRTRSELHEVAKHHFLRRTKSEVLTDLPEMIVQDLPIDLLPEQRTAYETAKFDSLNSNLDDNGAIFAQITKLKKICNFEPSSHVSAKMEVLSTLLESLTSSDDKVIVFSQYVESLEMIAEKVKLPVEIFHGSMSSSTRDGVLERFKTLPGPRVLLISIRAGGVGLNIPEASHVVLFDRWWNPAVEDQAVQRAHRFGRKTTLTVIKFYVVDSIEERILELLHMKRNLFSDLVEDAPSASFENSILRNLLFAGDSKHPSN